jgi:hypothetical protein
MNPNGWTACATRQSTWESDSSLNAFARKRAGSAAPFVCSAAGKSRPAIKSPGLINPEGELLFLAMFLAVIVPAVSFWL